MANYFGAFLAPQLLCELFFCFSCFVLFVLSPFACSLSLSRSPSLLLRQEIVVVVAVFCFTASLLLRRTR